VSAAQWLTDFSEVAIWLTAFFNRHYVVAVSSIMVLLALSFQPLSAALFSVREVFMELPGSAPITIIPDLAPSFSNCSHKCQQFPGNIP
jgi:Protein of unknown function (DUF3433)